jgi:hypothetical protein
MQRTGAAGIVSFVRTVTSAAPAVDRHYVICCGDAAQQEGQELPATWNHPELGRFEYRGGWAKELNFPAFKAFSYDTGYENARRSTGKHGMLFWANSEKDVPSSETAAVSSKVVANQAELVKKVAEALWDDFNGRGPDYGMWWHGSLKDVAKIVGQERPIRGPKDVLRLLQVDAVFIRRAYPEMGGGFDRPAAEIAFHAAFEPEHGVGVLTDGESILGIGYILDVVLFEPPKRSRKRSSR